MKQITEFETLGDRMKKLEERSETTLLPGVPVVARLDGRAFHTWTRGMARPYDERMQQCMQVTLIDLVDEFKPDIGYTQSDEISLVWASTSPGFDLRVQKLVSLLAARASSVFNAESRHALGETRSLASFDCRIFNVSDVWDAVDVLKWRQEDAVKNSIAMLAQANFSHNSLQGKHRGDMIEMLEMKGIMWEDMNEHFKRGVFARRLLHKRTLSSEELARIPEPFRTEQIGQYFVRSTVELVGYPQIKYLAYPAIALFEKLGVDQLPLTMQNMPTTKDVKNEDRNQE